ncbi:helix-turn-helix domain containing protein [Chryseobacterium oncorhynchi]|uniref:HTH luxR-type domain-containing protein n=1 Tax=Chryseobacterium oncorhynchi TaxID=741074 RepID=A0A316WD05_9FLAO|nr:helix-turn-helix domain containing protein [Chryseobacterium oncorhynchi]PWN59187.1 hypothetical protein C1638_021510 [Chryseobacterium oncorhynchi]
MNTKRRIIKFLKEGYNQKEIAEKFQELNIKPNSLSIIEKYLKEIKEAYGAKTLFHLACIMNENNELDFSNEEDV